MKRWLAALAFALWPTLAFGVQFSDDFNRPDNPDVGTSWTAQRGDGTGAQLVNQRVRSSALQNGSEESNASVLAPNQFARITLANFTGTGYGDAGVYLRAAAPPDRTFVACSAQKNDPATTVISRRLQGASALLASESATVWATGDVLEFSVIGSTYVCKRNGVVVLSVDDPNLTSGRVGFRVREDADLSQNEIDTFVAGDSAQVGVLTAEWIAPTTNTDGSALTDLALYRIYYLLTTSAAPCPGTQFYLMPAPLAAPPPNRTETFDMTGLVAGQPYIVMVTAVDSGGNESACSDSASAVARSTNAPPGALTNTRVQ